ncbi:uncharacterized protein LOC143357348 [Halictus rubicundus]|uniref:uncharacterized protein LOC143357348 n=1 Tax=Halictus rubicundus TaxID=77578 RepID=UPI004035670F
MKINNLHTLTDTFKILYGKPVGYQIKYYWKASWKTMPELMCLGIMAVSSCALLFYCAKKRLGDREPRYYRDITIFRPDDPRVPRIRRDNIILLQRVV